MNFREVLAKYQQNSTSTRDIGTKFEELILQFFKIYGPYKNIIRNIWLWKDFPYKTQFSAGQDVGIDLVIETYDGKYYSIQCKCYDTNYSISKDDLDTFISTSNKSFINDKNEKVEFSSMIFVSTTNRWSNNAQQVINNQSKTFYIISLNDLEEMDINWGELVKGKYISINKKTPRNHQQKAINKAVEYYKTADRGKLIMACGTGKTFTSLKIAEALAMEKFNNSSLSLSLSLSLSISRV